MLSKAARDDCHPHNHVQKVLRLQNNLSDTVPRNPILSELSRSKLTVCTVFCITRNQMLLCKDSFQCRRQSGEVTGDGVPGEPMCSRCPRLGCRVMRNSSSLGSLSPSVADSCCVVIFFQVFSSKVRPLLAVIDGGSLSSKSTTTPHIYQKGKNDKYWNLYGNTMCTYLIY